MSQKIRVAVLMGGRSREREVSLSTGRMIMSALDPQKYDAFAVDSALIGIIGENKSKIAIEGSSSKAKCTSNAVDELRPFDDIVRMNGKSPKPDVVIIALHGKFGEDGTIQGLLELLEIPYVGSGVLASALALNKIMARKVLEYEGIPVPKGLSIHRGDDVKEFQARVERVLGYPVIVKPNEEGSTIGISIVRSAEDFAKSIESAFEYDDDVLVEEFIEGGVEITGAVLGNEKPFVLPLVEIVPEGGFYDYHAKYTPGATEEICPARIPEEQYHEAERLALASHKALGCRGMSRTDMIVKGSNIWVLEVNTIPGMTPTSLLPRAAQAAGISFPRLLDMLIEYALEGRPR